MVRLGLLIILLFKIWLKIIADFYWQRRMERYNLQSTIIWSLGGDKKYSSANISVHWVNVSRSPLNTLMARSHEIHFSRKGYHNFLHSTYLLNIYSISFRGPIMNDHSGISCKMEQTQLSHFIRGYEIKQ